MASKKKYYSYAEFVSLYAKEEKEELDRLEDQLLQIPESPQDPQKYFDLFGDINEKQVELREDIMRKYTLSFVDDPSQLLNVIQKVIKALTPTEFQVYLKEARHILSSIKRTDPDLTLSSKTFLMTEENFENFYRFIYISIEREVRAAARLDLSDEVDRILLEHAGRYYPHKEGSLVIPHGKALNALAKMSAIKPSVDRVGNATFEAEDIKIVIEQFSQIKRSLNINAHKLLTVGISEFAKANSFKSNQALKLGIIFSFTEHAADRGCDIDDPKQMKDFRKKLQKDLKILKGQSLYWEEKINGHLINFDNLSIFGRVKLDGDCIYMEFTQSFAEYLSMLPLNQYCRNLMLIDGRNPNPYNIGIKMWEHYNLDNNIKKGNNNRLRVKSLLRASNLPSYEKILSQRGSWERKIKDPFEDALDDLVEYGVIKPWDYTKKNGEPLTREDRINLTSYHDWENLLVMFEIKDPKDHRKRIERKTQKRKSASSKKGANGVATK